MIRNFTLASLAGLGLLGAVPTADAMTAYASAGSDRAVAYAGRHHKRYRILYRTCAQEPWLVYGRFPSRWEADRAAHRLQHRGFEVFVR